MSLEFSLWGKKPKREEEPRPGPPPKWQVLVTRDAEREIEDLPGNVKAGVRDLVHRLGAWPEVSGVRPLWGTAAKGKFRLKFWDWRLEFTVDQSTRTITVERVGHRSEFYDPYHR